MSTSVLDKLGTNPGFRALFQVARHRDLARNRIVIKDGEAPGNLYLLLSGTVCVRHPGRHGEELLLAYFYAGDFFGEMCLFPGVPARSAMIRTASACSMLEIPYREFIRLSREHAELWLELAGQLAERLRSTNHRLAEMPALHAADRVWQVLQDMARRLRPAAPGGRIIQITARTSASSPAAAAKSPGWCSRISRAAAASACAAARSSCRARPRTRPGTRRYTRAVPAHRHCDDVSPAARHGTASRPRDRHRRADRAQSRSARQACRPAHACAGRARLGPDRADLRPASRQQRVPRL
ncbi:MAG: hypothetical protein NVS9B10_24980 [Nevskia sp.]